MKRNPHAGPSRDDACARLSRAWRYALMLAGALSLLTLAPASADELVKSGTVKIEQVQLAFIGSGNMGGGTLEFGGKSYKFTIAGLGVGGFGISKITAVGEVYNLTDVKKFPGAYGQARYGLAAGTKSAGELWLENPDGVYLHLKADRDGLALSGGADAIFINFD